jgi:hypothetical protein
VIGKISINGLIPVAGHVVAGAIVVRIAVNCIVSVARPIPTAFPIASFSFGFLTTDFPAAGFKAVSFDFSFLTILSPCLFPV